MECSICRSFPMLLRPPRNTICESCYEGAKFVINLVNKFENDQPLFKPTNLLSPSSPLSSCKALTNVSKWILHLKDREEELQEKIDYLSEFITAFRHQIHTDIQLKPRNSDSPSISAHRALLAIRSEIFKNILESDGCKSAPTNEITMPDLNHEELESLLEFLYGGDLPPEKLEKHVYALSMAADKYEIPYLLKFCESFMLKSLSRSNALEVLEIADVCSIGDLKESAMNFVIKNMEDVVFSAGFETFALKNPHLCVQITRASLMDAKKNRTYNAQ